VSNILIVESENDKYFMEAFISRLHLNSHFKVAGPICQIDDYKCLEGLDKDKLTNALRTLREERRKGNNIEKIGIIIDQDNETEENRITLINEAIHTAFDTSEKISKVTQWITVTIDEYPTVDTVDIACYFTNVDGKGELDTVLKVIKNRESIYADCLEEWRKCVEIKDKKLTNKEFDKFWVNVYQRYDCCSKKEKGQAGKKCSNEASFKKEPPIYNFNSPVLRSLKDFLNLFKNSH